MSDKKLDHIIATLADMLTMFGKRFDRIDDTLEKHSELHRQHERDFSQIKNQLADNLDKRKQLEVRVSNIEKKIAR